MVDEEGINIAAVFGSKKSKKKPGTEADDANSKPSKVRETLAGLRYLCTLQNTHIYPEGIVQRNYSVFQQPGSSSCCWATLCISYCKHQHTVTDRSLTQLPVEVLCSVQEVHGQHTSNSKQADISRPASRKGLPRRATSANISN